MKKPATFEAGSFEEAVANCNDLDKKITSDRKQKNNHLDSHRENDETADAANILSPFS